MANRAVVVGSIVAGLAFTLGCASGPKVRCGEGTELVASACLVTCAADQKRVGERCVARCESDTAFINGECMTLERALIATYDGYAVTMCGCKTDQDCAKSVAEKADAELESLAKRFPDADPRSAIESARDAYNRYLECQPESAVIAEFAALGDRMCACTDKPCTDTVNGEFEVWLAKNANAQGSEKEQERAKTIAQRYTECMMKAQGNAPTPPAPPAP